MSAPAISVLLPAYNAEAFLEGAIQSILAQSCQDFELIVVDDGSTDGTRNVAERHAGPRVRVLVNERNMGLTPTLNRALDAARGEFVARQDADDVSHPDRFARQLACLRTHPQLALLGTSAREVDGEGRHIGSLDMPLSTAAVRWAMLLDNPILHTAAMFRRHAVLAHGGYDETFAISQDYALWSKLAREEQVANLPDRLVTIRAHGESLMRSRGRQLEEETNHIQGANLAWLVPGRTWSARERSVLASFRWRISPGDLELFWRLWSELESAFLARFPAAAGDGLRETQAAQMSRVAYNLLPDSRLAALRVLGRASAKSPSVMSRLPWPKILALLTLGGKARGLYRRFAPASRQT